MNDDKFERLIRDVEQMPVGQIASAMDGTIKQHGDQLSDSQQVDLLYLEYLTRHSSGEPNVIDDICQRFPWSAQKLKRQMEVDTELSRSDTDSSSVATDQEGIPQKIGEYSVVEKIGEGAQAEVFRVVHPMLRCELAMKLGKQPGNSSDRVLAEGRLLVETNDPGTARVVDAGVWNQRPFVVSELVRGVTLKQRIEEGTLEREEFVRIMVHVCRTVQRLHSAGIIHCDIKSTNILIDPDGKPKLVDFGLAINRNREGWDEAERFKGNHSAGTLVYMAPELFRSTTDVDSASHRLPISDVFSLGSLLYFGLTGKHPYAHVEPSEVVNRVAEGLWDQETLARSDVPTALKEICKASMATNPTHRTNTAGRLADILQCWLDRNDVQWKSRKVTGVAALLAIVFFGWLALRPDRNETPEYHATVAGAPTSSTAIAQRFGKLDLTVWNQVRAFELVHRVPLRTGERIQVTAPLRANHRGELWIVTSEGIAERLATFEPRAQRRLADYPDDPSQAVAVSGPAGTEAIVWLEFPENGRQTLNQKTTIAELLTPAQHAWPPIDSAMVFRMVDGELIVQQDGRSLGPPEHIEAPSAMVQKHLHQVTDTFQEHSVGVEIIVFSHIE